MGYRYSAYTEAKGHLCKRGQFSQALLAIVTADPIATPFLGLQLDVANARNDLTVVDDVKNIPAIHNIAQP
jgi:hypothetical protein